MFKLTKIVKMKLYDRLDLTCIHVSKKLQNWVYKFKDVFSFPLKEYSTAFFPTYMSSKDWKYKAQSGENDQRTLVQISGWTDTLVLLQALPAWFPNPPRWNLSQRNGSGIGTGKGVTSLPLQPLTSACSSCALHQVVKFLCCILRNTAVYLQIEFEIMCPFVCKA